MDDSIDAARPLTWVQMSTLFARIAERLDQDLPIEIVIAGGSSLAYFVVRDLTHDVDVITEIPPGLRVQIARVADELGLAANWMNNQARPFRQPMQISTRSCFRAGRSRSERSRRTTCS